MASSDTPELEELSFYQQLISNFSDLYNKAQSSCSIIVIPQYLPNISSLTRDICESHLFRPSPCYLRKHLSWNEKYEIEYDKNKTIRVLHKKAGAGEKRVKIISQEDVRDTVRQNAYTILIIDQPLVDINGTNKLQTDSLVATMNKFLIPSPLKFDSRSASYESSFMFLDSLRQIAPAFESLRTSLFLFNETYVVLPKYVGSAVDKLAQLRDKFLQESYQLLNKNVKENDIELASEIYITGNTYTKVWPIILQHNEEKEKILFENIRQRQRKQLTDANRNNSSPSQSALSELKRLDELKTAYEKAKCIRSALDSTIAAHTLMIVDTKAAEVRYHSSSDPMPMAADETLSAFIDLICHLISNSDKKDYVHLIAHEYYTEKFRFLSLPQDIDYAFTTFQGVLKYLTDNLS